MGQVIGEILPEAVGVAISPVPIIAIVLMLGSAKGRSNGFAFLAGWLAGLIVAGTLVLVLADPAGAATDTGPAAWVGWVVIALGALLLVMGLKQWQGRPRRGEEAEMPGWMKMIDQFTPGKSFGMGVLLAGLNPKNLSLTLAAAAVIASAGLSAGSEYAALGIFVLVGTIGLLIPLGIYLLMGDRAPALLRDLNEWLADHNAAIMTVLLIVIGVKMFGTGLGIVLA